MFRKFALAALFLASCAQSPAGVGGGVPMSQPVTLAGNYALVALNRQAVQTGITMDVAGDDSFSGQAPCNRYFGTVAAQSDFRVAFSPIGATKRACPALSLESSYFAALGAATQYRTANGGGTLGLFDASGQELASFTRGKSAPSQPAPQVSVEGNWLITAASINGVLANNPGPSGTSISFSEARREFSANLGCNSASGPYTLNGNALDFGAIAVTNRPCFAPAPLEGAILTALELTRTAVETPTGLDLVDASGRAVLRLLR